MDDELIQWMREAMPLPAHPTGDPASVPKHHSERLEFQSMKSSKVIPSTQSLGSLFLKMITVTTKQMT